VSGREGVWKNEFRGYAWFEFSTHDFDYNWPGAIEIVLRFLHDTVQSPLGNFVKAVTRFLRF
jgi:hypothetical protein